MKRTILLLLADLLAISGMLTACGSKNDPGSETTPSGNQGGEQTGGDPDATPDIPADYQIGGEFRVLSYNANVSEFGEADVETSDAVN